jgi:hypothetical protein
LCVSSQSFSSSLLAALDVGKSMEKRTRCDIIQHQTDDAGCVTCRQRQRLC